MSTDRRIYASQAIFISASPSTGIPSTGVSDIVQLERVQSFNDNKSLTRQNVNQFGELAAISREITDPPTVAPTCEWLAVNANNESGLGFITDGSVSAFSGIINGTVDDRNVFNLIAPNDEDAVGNASANNEFVVEGYGNCFLNNYSVRGSVGAFATASVSWEGLNYRVHLNKSGVPGPAINPTNGVQLNTILYNIPDAVSGMGVPAIRHGDITVSLIGASGIGIDVTDAKIQSYEISASLQRDNLNKMGSLFAFKKKIRFPTDATATITMDVGDYVSGSLADRLCNDVSTTVQVTLRKPSCTGSGPVALIYQLKNAKLDTQPSNQNIGGNKSVTMTFSTQIAGAEDVSNGFFLSGLKE